MPPGCFGTPGAGGYWTLGAYFPALASKVGSEFGTLLLSALCRAPELPIKGNVPQGRFALQD